MVDSGSGGGGQAVSAASGAESYRWLARHLGRVDEGIGARAFEAGDARTDWGLRLDGGVGLQSAQRFNMGREADLHPWAFMARTPGLGQKKNGTAVARSAVVASKPT
jgi:hypothetical protein